ncbi:MAG: hypothetical protein RLZZ241_2143 [Bacteroidota bacterium]|jgi:3-oxoacid CoA-transferase
MKKKTVLTAAEAAAKVNSGDILICGGFGMTGAPVHLLHALADTQTHGITFVGNNVGESNLGGGKMLLNGQISKMIGSYFTSNKDAVAAAQGGKVAYEILPQGTLAEAIRAGGAGLGGFYTPTSFGTLVAKGKETKNIDGKDYVFEKAIRGNVSFIRAYKADELGNLVYRRTEQNFNKAAATASDLVIVEVEEIVPAGTLAPDEIHTQGCYVDYLVQAHTTLEELGSSASVDSSIKKVDDVRMRIAERVLKELQPGNVVNLGIGIPTLVADLITPEDLINLHTENGMLGVGPAPTDGGGAMDYPVNAGKIPVTALQGSSYFDSADSFAMIRGGQIDVAVMGGLQVDQSGNLANWAVPGKPLLGVGGAMDLASGAKKLIITMTHLDAKGQPKIVPSCTLPLTAFGVVDLVVTDMAVFEFISGELTLIELMPGITLEEVSIKTTASFKINLR